MAFDKDKFKRIHNHNGQLNGVADETIEFWLQVANAIIGGENSVVKDATEREFAIQLMVCHIAYIQAKGTANNIVSASEGSVNVGSSIIPSLNRSWLCTSPCGVLLWNLLAKYRVPSLRWYNMPPKVGY